MGYYNIVNYIDICSNALLAIIDNDECIIERIDNIDNIIINNKLKQLLFFYIKSFIKEKHCYGKQNILLNSCNPFENFRKNENDITLTQPKYEIADKQYFNIDLQLLEKILEKIWYKLRTDDLLGRFIFLSHKNIDIVDFINIMRIYIDNLYIDKCHYFFLEDKNNEYLHYNNIEKKLIFEVETELRRNELIL